MTRFSYHIVAGLISPFVPIGLPLSYQARAAVEAGLWINWITLEAGVTWERMP